MYIYASMYTICPPRQAPLRSTFHILIAAPIRTHVDVFCALVIFSLFLVNSLSRGARVARV